MNNKNDQNDPTIGAARTFPIPKQRPKRGIPRSLPWLVLVISLLITWLVWHYAMDTVNLAKNEYFDFRVKEATTRIVRRMHAYQQVLLGIQGLYKAFFSVERHEFKAYVDSLDLADNYPGIQGVGFSLIVPAAQKKMHVAAIRKQGFPGYDILPEGQRELYTSIIYLEPFASRNLRAFGYDMYSEPVRRAAMEKARDSGDMAMSGKLRLVQESGGQAQAGFLLYIPVYRSGLPHSTLKERRANIIGWAYSPFRMNDLMNGIHGEHASDLDIEIYDGKEVTLNTLMYDSEGGHAAAASSQDSKYSSNTIEVAGHPWTIHIRALEGIQSRVDSNRPALIAGAGVVISLLLAWLTWSLVIGRERAIREVQEKEKLIDNLQKAIDEIKTLRGILPICSICKKIRDDAGSWSQMEAYISNHSAAEFSHGYCPECAQKAMEEVKQFLARKPGNQQ